MSFKYRFILSFVILEFFFILLIVMVNFFTIKDSSERLISEKIESNISFLEELIKVPISIYDLASLDNLVERSSLYMNSIVILDTQDRVLSSFYSYEYMKLEDLLNLKDSVNIETNEHTYKIKYQKIYENNELLGSMYIIFDTTSSSQFINENKNNTFFIILIQILISTYLSYIIGNRITKKLTNLSDIAILIGSDKYTDVPYTDSKDEIGNLAKSMNRMQLDLTSRTSTIKESNKLLEKQKDDLIVANKVKDDFLANMSHELKTPLNSINVISSIMKKNNSKNLDTKQVKNLSIINNCGNELLNLINDILDISKLQAGKVNIFNSKVNLRKTINNLKETYEVLFLEKNLEFTVYFDANIKIINSDEDKIRQIISNILSNALKFSSSGKVSLKVKNEKNNILFIIQDEGLGISKEKVAKLFDPFKQLDSSISRRYTGTGLGLSITRGFLKLLNGSIYVESELNIGSTFFVRIPKNIKNSKLRSYSKIQNSLKGKDLIINEPNSKEKKIRKKILVLNTDPLVFLNLIIKLQKEHEIIQVNLESNFLDKISMQKIDNFIFDIDKVSKYFIKQMLEIDKNKIIIISESEVNEEIKEKIDNIFLKPVDLNKIITCLEIIK